MTGLSGQVDFRVPGEAAEYLRRLIIPAIIIVLLVATLGYAVYTYGMAYFTTRLLASSFFIAGMVIGGVLMLVIFRLFVRWRFFNHVVSRSIKASVRNLPEIYRIASGAAARLGMDLPGVYVVQDPEINAFAMGAFRKIIVLNTGMIDATDEDELTFILGHELSHVKYGWSVPLRVAGIAIPVPLVLSSRRREFTCDRGGLIASRNLDKSIRVLAKLALGKSLAGKVDVGRLYRDEKEVEDDRMSRLSEALATHPPIKNRVLELRKFHGSELYKKLAESG